MIGFSYGAALLASIAGLGLVDRRFKLAVFADPRRALACVGIGVAFFLAWDAAGVGLGIFFVGDAPYLTGWRLAPNVPVEELLFLTLLNYQTLMLWRAFARRSEAP